jgi:ABC-2 type transport system ATP-binding protein
MKRRVNIGVALLHRPRVLYLDEPTVGIDPQSRRAILDGILDLNRQGMTVLYTTHYMEEAQEISNRIGIMDHGKIVALGTNDELVRIVGEQARVEITVDHDLDRALAAWCRVEGVSSATEHDGAAHLAVTDATTVLPHVFEHAQQSGIHVTGISVTPPNLETVFLHLTGRALRD